MIGLPGDTVEIRNGTTYQRLRNAGTIFRSTATKIHGNLSLKKVDKHYYFVMGDNRDNSLDSREWGLVPEKYIYGKVFFRFWRPASAGWIQQGEFQFSNEDDKDTRAQLD